MRLGIVGAGSFVGRAVASHLAQSHPEIGVEEIDALNGAWRAADLSHYGSLLHVAGVVPWALDRVALGIRTEDQERAYLDAANAVLARDVAEAARAAGVPHLVFLSTSDVYAKSASADPSFVVDADTAPAPENPYGESKLKAEGYLRAIEGPGFAVAVLRPPLVYGPNCARGTFASLARLSARVPAFPRVHNARSLLYTGNLSELVAILAEGRIGGTFLPQDAEWASTSDLVRILGEAQGNRVRMVPGLSGACAALARANATARKAFGGFRYDHAASSEELGYQVYGMEEALRASVA